MKRRTSLTTDATAPTGIPDAQGPRRIAMFLMELGVQVTADVLNQLTPEEFGQVSGAIANLESIDADEAEASEDSQAMKANGLVFAKLGPDYVLHFVREALRSETHRAPASTSRRSQGVASISSSAALEIGLLCG